MPTTAQRLLKKEVTVSDQGVEALETALRLLFGDLAVLYYMVNDQGFHVSTIRVDRTWTRVMKSDLGVELLNLAVRIQGWLNGLTREQALLITTARPLEETYSRDPGIDLVGFRFTGWCSHEGNSYEATIIPGWV